MKKEVGPLEAMRLLGREWPQMMRALALLETRLALLDRRLALIEMRQVKKVRVRKAGAR